MEREKRSNIHTRQIPRHNQSVFPDERSPRRTHSLFAIGCERNVGGARVTSVERPFCFAVAYDEDAWGGHWEGFLYFRFVVWSFDNLLVCVLNMCLFFQEEEEEKGWGRQAVM